MSTLSLYDEKGYFIETIAKVGGVIYENSTDIEPVFNKEHPKEIYNPRFDKFTKVWHYELKQDYINEKAKELGLELNTIYSMNDEDLKTGKIY